jgi:hypothetical protein
MNQLAEIVAQQGLLQSDQKSLNALKNVREAHFFAPSTKLYKNSLYKKDGLLFCIACVNNEKALFIISKEPFKIAYSGKAEKDGALFVQRVEFSFSNAELLKKDFPFTAPVSLREKKTTVGCGDRLGLASPGHIRAAKQFDFYPVLAQQSIRELNFTKRTYKDVTSDVVFAVFQEGFERGYGADGDHLKTLADIDTALAADMPMITLDLSEVMNPGAGEYGPEKIEAEFKKIDGKEQKRLLAAYAEKSFRCGTSDISLSPLDVKKCALMYAAALDFAKTVDLHLKKHRGDKYDLEISIDETTYPTLPEHHLFIIKELLVREVVVNSLAPRFIGEFQKAIDYIGDVKEFEKQFRIHCEIAKAHGNYKVSVHSGSDKFSVYPVIGKCTGLKLHLKTAGTSWLEAVRCIAQCSPALYRKLHKKAFVYFENASKFYHITADLSKIKDIDAVPDSDLPEFLVTNESRQLLHITYGGLLNDPELRGDFFAALNAHEDAFYDIVEKHFVKHVSLLGIPVLK